MKEIQYCILQNIQYFFYTMHNTKTKGHKYIGLFLLLFTFGSFLFYYISQSFYFDAFGNLKTFSWTLNSDWMMHMAQVQAFEKLDFLQVIQNNPIYSGELLAYPFFVNWLSGILLQITDNIVFSMLFPMYVGTVLLLSGIYFLTYQLTKNIYTAFLTPIIFFFLAGAQAYFTLQEYNLFSETWKNLKDYEYDIHFLGNTLSEMGYVFNWKSFFLTTFIPQRSFLWGMAIGTFMLGVFVKIQNIEMTKENTTEENNKNKQFRRYCIYFSIGLGIGLLSFIHTHTFFYFFFLFLLLFVSSSIHNILINTQMHVSTLSFVENFKYYFSLGLGAMCTSLPFLYVLFQKKGGVSAFSLFPFGEGNNIFEYLLLNWGIVFVLGGLLLVRPLYRIVIQKISINNNTALLYNFLLASAILLGVFSIWQLQSNPWDNTKVLLWSGLFFSMSASIVFVYVWNSFGGFGKLYSGILFLFSVMSGVIMFWSGVDDDHYQIFSAQEIHDSKYIEQKIDSGALILTSDYYHHFISPLLSNPIFMGYRGWIGSYGMDWEKKVEIAKIIYSGGEYAGKYKKLKYQEVLKIIENENIEYIFVDNSASLEYKIKINEEFFNRYFEKIVDLGSRGVLYRRIEK